MVTNKCKQLASLCKWWVQGVLNQDILLGQQAENLLGQDRVADLNTLKPRCLATSVKDLNVRIISDQNAIAGVLILVAVYRYHRWHASSSELLPHFAKLHRPIVVAVHQQKTGIDSVASQIDSA